MLQTPSPLAQKPATKPFYPFITRGLEDKKMLYQPHSRFPLRPDVPHKDAYKLVAMSLHKKTDSEKEMISRIWSEFIARLFRFPAHWIRNELRSFKKDHRQSSIVRCKCVWVSSCCCHFLPCCFPSRHSRHVSVQLSMFVLYVS